MEIIFGIIFLIFTVIVIVLLQKNNKQHETELKNRSIRLIAEKEDLVQNQIKHISEIAQLKAQLQSKEELLIRQQEELLNMRNQLNKDFQVLANQILEEKTQRFTTTNKENIEAILKPLNEKLVEFKSKVEETYDKESKQRFSLEERIRELVALNNQISTDANNLTKALKGNNKIQGNWGEMILESILEKSGLKKGEEYYVQETIKDEFGRTIQSNEGNRMQPDIIVSYPGGRKIVIDSKVSLTAYVRYIEAETDEEKAVAEKEHILSVKQHID